MTKDNFIIIIIKLIVVITVAIYLFITFTFDILNISFEKRSLTFNIIFDHATSVQKGTQLEMSGFRVGEVVELTHTKYKNSTKAKVKVMINEKYRSVITDKADIYIARRKFIGLTFIQIIPQIDGKIVSQDDTFYGISTPRYNLLGDRIDELLKFTEDFLVKSHFIDLLKEYTELTKNIKEIKNNHKKRFDKIKKDLIQLVKNSKKLYKVYNDTKDIDFDKLMDRSNRLMKIAQNDGGVLFDKSEELVNELLTMKDDIQPLLNKGKKEYKPLLDKINSIVSKLETILDKTEKLATTLEDVGNIALFLNDKEIMDYSRAIFRIIKQESYRYIDPFPLY